MVAGAYKAEMLSDFREAVDKAIVQGTTLADFRKDFDRIVTKHGWSYNGSRGWRSEVIYSTNLRTSYAAGRWAQLTDPEFRRVMPYLVYRHGDSRVPRPLHLSWDGTTLPADDPWWNTHYVPNGWGCKCKVFGATKSEYEAALRAGKGEAPPSPIDPRTGEPIGIDKGWGYNVGIASQAKYKILEGAFSRLPEDIAALLEKEIASRDRKAGREARKIREAAKKARATEDTLTDIGAWKKVGAQKGSNPGGLYEAPDGERYYVKLYKDDAQARTELASNAVYRMMGVDMPDLSLRTMDGKVALASKWRADMKPMTQAEMIAHPEEMARIFQASVLTGNWDVVGMSYDNVMLGKKGRLAMIDAGGSFKFRAQGGAKAYEAVPNEVNTLRDAKLNPQSASVFNAIFGKDVWLEREGAKPLLELKKTDVKKVFANAGFQEAEAKEVTETLWSRRQWLVERYDLEGKYLPKGDFGRHLDAFKAWGTSRWEPNEVGGMINGSRDSRFTADVEDLVKKFEAYVIDKINPWGRGVLRALFSEWSGSSSSSGGATIKLWAESRFGNLTKYHAGRMSRTEVAAGLEDGTRRSLEKAKLPKETVFSLLDAEYEFQQYLMRRLHSYEEIPAIRFMSRDEYAANFKRGVFSGNAVQSVTVKPNGFGGNRCVRMMLRVEDTLKTYYQGVKYMYYGKGESEYVVIGRAVNASTAR
jgi:hypothetical protein